MGRFEEAAQIDTEPFDSDLLDEIYIRPYAQEVYMTDVFATLLFRYFELFDRRYGTNISEYVNIGQIIGYCGGTDLDYMIWYQEAAYLLAGAMNDTGWSMGALNTEEVKNYLNDTEESMKDEDLVTTEYQKCLDDIFDDCFLKDALLRESKIMKEAVEEMEEGNLVIVWNTELNDYMQFREKHPDIIGAVCKDEDQWIVRLEEDIWEPYMAFYRQEKDTLDGMAYCKVVLGNYMDSYVSFEAVNPNWICKAVKLSKMLQLANEKLAYFRAGQKKEEAA